VATNLYRRFCRRLESTVQSKNLQSVLLYNGRYKSVSTVGFLFTIDDGNACVSIISQAYPKAKPEYEIAGVGSVKHRGQIHV
jgi:hypothetical protein